MEDQNVAIRLKGFIDSQGLSHSQFADRCGIPRPSLSQILSGRNKKVSDVIVGQIHKTFPRLSVLWLMFGEGPMLTPDYSEASTTVSDGDITFSDGSLFPDDSNFAMETPTSTSRTNVSVLNKPSDGSNKPNYKTIEADSRIAELQRQIDKLRQNPRKVSHITVYYDDSTFETFFPR